MNDLRNIEENYTRMSIEELRRLTTKPHELRLEVIPILQQELLNRGQNKDAMSLTDFLVKSKAKPRFSEMSIIELKQLIGDRLDSGESIESIKIDLKDDGIDIFDIINDDNKLKEKAFDYITHLKQQGLKEKEIDEKLKETFSIGEEDSETLKIQLKKKGNQNLILGYSISIIALLLIVISLSVGRSVTVAGVVILAISIGRVIKGHEQLKK
jgi:hypothetical protein